MYERVRERWSRRGFGFGPACVFAHVYLGLRRARRLQGDQRIHVIVYIQSWFPGQGPVAFKCGMFCFMSGGYGIGACSSYGVAVPIPGQLLCTVSVKIGWQLERTSQPGMKYDVR